MKESEQKQIETQMKQKFEEMYQKRFLTMKNFYDLKHETLIQTIRNSYKKVLEDEILSTMVKDTTTGTFIEQRVKELFLDIIGNEREIMIEQLGKQYSDLKFSEQELNNKYQRLKKQTESAQQRIFQDSINIQSEKSQIYEALRKKEEEVFQLKLEIKEAQSVLKEKERIIQDCQTTIHLLKEENIEFKVRIQQIHEEIDNTVGEQKIKFELKNVDLVESQRKLSQLEEYTKELNRVNQEKLDAVEKRWKKKIGEYKSKIQEYKDKMKELIRNNRPDNEREHVDEIRELEKRIMTTMKENDRKLGDLKNLKQKEKQELEKKYEGRYQQLQGYYDKILEEKIKESKKIAEEAAESIMAEEEQLRKYIQYLESNSTPSEQYTKLAQFCQQLRDKLAEGQQAIFNYNQQNQELTSHINELLKQEQNLKGHNQKLEKYIEQLSKNIKTYEQHLQGSKRSEEKMRIQKDNLGNELNIKLEENKILQANLEEMQSKFTACSVTLRDNEKLIQERNSSIERLEGNVKRMKDREEELRQQLQGQRDQNNSLGKKLMEKQHILATIEQKYGFKNEVLENQLQQLKGINQQDKLKIKDLTEEISKQRHSMKEVLSQKTTHEAEITKLQMENKRYKQVESSLRSRFEKETNETQQELEEKQKIIKNLKNNLCNEKRQSERFLSSLERKNRKLNQKLNKMLKIYQEEIDTMKRSLKDMKNYLLGTMKLFGNQIRINENNMTLKLKEQMFNMSSNYKEEQRKIKEVFQNEKKNYTQACNNKIEKLELSYKQRMEAESKNNKAFLESKDKDIERLEKEKKKHVGEKEDLMEDIRALEKKVQQIHIVLENEKIQNKAKVTELLREFDGQRERIINQYESKRDKQEQEMQEILRMMKNIKKQLDQNKAQYEKEKSQWSCVQMGTNAKERALEKDLDKKKNQIDKLNLQINELKQGTSRLQFEYNAICQKNQRLSHDSSERQLENNKINGELIIYKNKSERLSEQNQSLRHDLKEKEMERTNLQITHQKTELELRQLKQGLKRASKNQDIKISQHLDMSTKQLSSKVNELKRMGFATTQENHTPLRY